MTVSKLPFPSFQKPRYVPWEVFEQKYLPRVDTWKYEWVNGIFRRPVLSDFKITAKDLFKKPPKPNKLSSRPTQ